MLRFTHVEATKMGIVNHPYSSTKLALGSALKPKCWLNIMLGINYVGIGGLGYFNKEFGVSHAFKIDGNRKAPRHWPVGIVCRIAARPAVDGAILTTTST